MDSQIFFYGTLKRDIVLAKRNFLQRVVKKAIDIFLDYRYDTFILRGRLFLMEDESEKYPCMMPDNTGYPIFGELYTVLNSGVIDLIDEYECVSEGVFVRSSVIMNGENTIVYTYNKSVTGLPELLTGRFEG